MIPENFYHREFVSSWKDEGNILQKWLIFIYEMVFLKKLLDFNFEYFRTQVEDQLYGNDNALEITVDMKLVCIKCIISDVNYSYE